MNRYILVIVFSILFLAACKPQTKQGATGAGDSLTMQPSQSALSDSIRDTTQKILQQQGNNEAQSSHTPPGMVIGKDGMPQSTSFEAKGADERRRGVELAAKGDLKGALELFNQAIQISERNPDGYFLRGKAKRELKDFPGSEADLSKAIRLRKQPSYYFSRGQLYMDWKKFREANADFDSTLMKQPDNLDAMNFKGVALANMGKHAEAIAIYDEVIEKSPNTPLAYYNRGTSLAALERFPESEESFTKAISINPNYEQAYVNRGNSRLMQNKHQDAWDDYSMALSFNPKNKDALYNSGFALKQLKNNNLACENWRKAVAAGHPLAQQQLDKYCK